MTKPPISALVLSETTTPWWSTIQVEESLEPIEDAEFFRTVNRKVEVLSPDADTLWRVSLSARGNGTLWMPSFDGWAVGRQVVVDCLSRFTAAIRAGGTQVILAKTPVPGSVEALDEQTNAVVPVSVTGRTVSIAAARAGHLAVVYRPRLTCVVTRLPRTSTSVQDALQPWELVLEEDGVL